MNANLEMLKGTGSGDYIYPYTIRNAVVDEDGTSAFANLKNEICKVLYTNEDNSLNNIEIDLKGKNYLSYAVEYECTEMDAIGYVNIVLIPGTATNGNKMPLNLVIDTYSSSEANENNDISIKYLEIINIDINNGTLLIEKSNTSNSYQTLYYSVDDGEEQISSSLINKSIMKINKIIGIMEV